MSNKDNNSNSELDDLLNNLAKDVSSKRASQDRLEKRIRRIQSLNEEIQKTRKKIVFRIKRLSFSAVSIISIAAGFILIFSSILLLINNSINFSLNTKYAEKRSGAPDSNKTKGLTLIPSDTTVLMPSNKDYLSSKPVIEILTTVSILDFYDDFGFADEDTVLVARATENLVARINESLKVNLKFYKLCKDRFASECFTLRNKELSVPAKLKIKIMSGKFVISIDKDSNCITQDKLKKTINEKEILNLKEKLKHFQNKME